MSETDREIYSKRANEIKDAANEKFLRLVQEGKDSKAFDFKQAFLLGAQYADEHPHLISYKEQLPPMDRVILAYDINENKITYFGKLQDKDELNIIALTHWMLFPEIKQ